MDLTTVNTLISKIKTTTTCSAVILCKIGCILEYLNKLLGESEKADKVLNEKLEALKVVVDSIITDTTDLTERMSTVEYRLDVEVPQKFAEHLALIRANSTTLDSHDLRIAGNLNEINIIKDLLRQSGTGENALAEDIREINRKINNLVIEDSNLKGLIDSLRTEMQSKFTLIDQTTADHAGKIGNLETKDIDLQNQISTLRELVSQLSGGSVDITVDLTDVKNRISALETSLSSFDDWFISGMSFDNNSKVVVTVTNPTTGETRTNMVNIPLASAGNAGYMSAAHFTKLEGIAAGAEVNVQSDWSVTDTTLDSYILNKPDKFPTDLSLISDMNSTWRTNLAAAPSQYVTRWPSLNEVTGINADWKTLLPSAPPVYVTRWPAWGEVTGKPTFATVATSGDFNDLSNKPAGVTLPRVTVTNAFPGDVSAVEDGAIFIVPGSGELPELTGSTRYMLMGTTMICWGTTNSSGKNTVSVTFPRAFTNVCHAVFLQVYGDMHIVDQPTILSRSVTGFTFKHYGGESAVSLYYFAVGN